MSEFGEMVADKFDALRAELATAKRQRDAAVEALKALHAKIDSVNDLHAVFIIKDSAEFIAARATLRAIEEGRK